MFGRANQDALAVAGLEKIHIAKRKVVTQSLEPLRLFFCLPLHHKVNLLCRLECRYSTLQCIGLLGGRKQDARTQMPACIAPQLFEGGYYCLALVKQQLHKQKNRHSFFLETTEHCIANTSAPVTKFQEVNLASWIKAVTPLNMRLAFDGPVVK